MPTLFPSSGDHGVAFTGVYNFNDGKLFIPEVETLPAIDQPIGSIWHVKVSGLLCVQSGVGMQTANYALSNLPFVEGPLSAMSPLELNEAIHFWGEASGIAVAVPGQSGVSQWYSSTEDGQAPYVDGGTGGGAGWVASGVTPAGKDAIFMAQGALTSLKREEVAFSTTEQPLSMICVVKNHAVTGAGAIWGGGRSTSDFLEQFLLYQSSSNETIALNRDTNTHSITGGETLPADNFQILTFVSSGTQLSIYQSGTLVGGPTNWGTGNTNLINQLGIGYWSRQTPDSHNTMEIAEIAMWESGLSDRDRASLQLYMADKHGLTLANSGI